MATGAQLIAVLLAGALEGVGVPWPGAIVLATAAAGVGAQWHGVASLALIFGVGYTVGALTQYALGRLLGPVALAWLPQGQRIRLDRFLTRFGTKAVFWTRPLAVGNYISAPAGVLGMPLGRFVLYTFLGICPWALGMVQVGALAGSYVGGLQELVAEYTVLLVVAAGACAVGTLLWKLARRPLT